MNTSSNRPFVAGALSLIVPGLGQIYNGHVFKGVVVFFTAFLVVPYVYGVIDAYVWARRHQRLHRALRCHPRALLGPPIAPPRLSHAPSPNTAPSLQTALLRAARDRGGRLSVTEGVMETGRSFKEVEKTLDEMAHSGYVDIGNHPESGVVVYQFAQF